MNTARYYGTSHFDCLLTGLYETFQEDGGQKLCLSGVLRYQIYGVHKMLKQPDNFSLFISGKGQDDVCRNKSDLKDGIWQWTYKR